MREPTPWKQSIKNEIGKIWVSWHDLFLVPPLCLWADGLNNEDSIGFLPELAGTGRRSAF